MHAQHRRLLTAVAHYLCTYCLQPQSHHQFDDESPSTQGTAEQHTEQTDDVVQGSDAIATPPAGVDEVVHEIVTDAEQSSDSTDTTRADPMAHDLSGGDANHRENGAGDNDDGVEDHSHAGDDGDDDDDFDPIFELEMSPVEPAEDTDIKPQIAQQSQRRPPREPPLLDPSLLVQRKEAVQAEIKSITPAPRATRRGNATGYADSGVKQLVDDLTRSRSGQSGDGTLESRGKVPPPPANQDKIVPPPPPPMTPPPPTQQNRDAKVPPPPPPRPTETEIPSHKRHKRHSVDHEASKNSAATDALLDKIPQRAGNTPGEVEQGTDQSSPGAAEIVGVSERASPGSLDNFKSTVRSQVDDIISSSRRGRRRQRRRQQQGKQQ